MSAAIQFDREFCSRAVKIEDIQVERMLAPEFVTCEIAVS
jgi:hypothetical protein